MKNDVFSLLQTWYLEQCDGDWEHEFGIKIDTLDNPGWAVVIDLVGTKCENKIFEEIDRQINESDWIQCDIKEGKFLGYDGPTNLSDLIKIFIVWSDN